MLPRTGLRPKTPCLKEAVKYGLVGILNTAIGITVIYGLMYLGVNYLASNVAAYALGLLNSFVWNKYWTFRNKADWIRQIGPFVTAFLVCYFVQLASVVFGVACLGLPKHLMQLAGMAVFTILNFVVNKYVVFRQG